jgi:hypothetical protein
MKYIYLLTAALCVFSGGTVFASTPCTAFTNFANLQAAGSCTGGPNGDVTFSNFQTSASPNVRSQIVVTAVTNSGKSVNPGLYGFIFNTNQLTTPTVMFSFQSQCDSTCLFNDTFDRIEGNGGSGEFVINGQTLDFTNGQTYFAPTFTYINTVQSFGIYTVTAVANMAASTYEMDVNIIPSAWGTGSTCPTN